MHYISLIALAAVIPAALSYPVSSDPLTALTARDAGYEARSVDLSDTLLQARKVPPGPG